MNKNLKKLQQEESDLGSKGTDALVATGKGMLSLIPFVGSFLAELIAFTIPNQRQDRLENFVLLLAQNISENEAALGEKIEQKLEEKLKDPETVPFMEKVLRQVIDSESEVKRKHLASIVKNGLTKDIDLIDRERLLKIFGELNEIEILRLYGASLDSFGNEQKYDAFWDKYEDQLFYEPEWDAPKEADERAEILISYSRNLVNMGLIDKTDISARTTTQGKSLLKFIDAEKNIEL